MAGNYIPTTDSGLNDWAINFSALLTASPTTYGQVAAVAVAVASVQDAYTAAYAMAIDPSTRTPVTVNAKDDARINFLAVVQPIAVQISLNAGVLSADKIAIGVNPRTTGRTPIPTPNTSPVLSVANGEVLQQIVRYRDETASPTSKAKAAGAVQIQIFAMVSATPITDQNAIAFYGVATKSPNIVMWDSGDAGKKAYYAARWVTRTGKVGPWSAIVSLTVAN